jgi:hypothetical protein
MSETAAPSALQRRLSSLVSSYQRRRARAASSRWILPAVAAFVLLGILWSWQRLDLDLQSLDARLLAASAGLAIPAALLSAVEYILSQRLVGNDSSPSTAISVALMGSLGNLLPIPGGAMVRVDAMTSSGSRLSVAVRTTAGIGLVWVGLALISSGTAIALLGRTGTGAVLGGIGALIAVAGVTAIRPRSSRQVGLTAAVFFVEILVIVLATMRIYFVLAAIGEDASWTQSLGLVASGAVAVSVGLVPAGLGVRELIAGLLAPLVGLTAAAGFLTAGINQILSLVGQGLLAVIVRPRRD